MAPSDDTESELAKNSASNLPEQGGSAASEPDVEAAQDDLDATRSLAKASTTANGSALCGVCSINTAKYKCPRCYLRYCSIACNKTHRENHPPDPEPEEQPKPASAPAKDEAVPNATPDHANPFRALDSSDRLQYLFRKYPSLPNQLQQIYAATQPPAESASASTGIPASLMKGLPQKDRWNHDMGIQSGKAALRKARKAEGEEGAAIREYSQLVLHMMDEADPQGDATSVLQQQVAHEDAKLVERLMETEKS